VRAGVHERVGQDTRERRECAVGEELNMPKRKDPARTEEEAPMLTDPVATFSADPMLVNSYGLRVFERSDGKWALVAERDGETQLVSEWKPKRLFLRDYHRSLDRFAQIVFKGAIRSMG
jgi:hypothetical protein